jgi:branched-chain amino acid transport system substrate-binding protein
MTSPGSRRLRRSLSFGLVALLTISGCGTRMSSERIAVADGSALSAPATSTPQVGTDAPPAVGAGVPDVPAGPGTQSAVQPGAAGGTAKVTDNQTVAPIQPKAPASNAAMSNPATTTTAACTQALAPLVLGQTAPSSGVIGATHANLRTGLALWLRAVNARGGISCHPVQLYQMDDGADPARVVSNLNELVKNKHAVALVGVGVPTTFPAAKKFAEQNQVPIIGGDETEPAWFSSPWIFPEGGSPLAEYAGAFRAAADSIHAKKVGIVYCIEASICGTINSYVEQLAKASDLQVVLRRAASITAPDYSAECQAMRDAGAQVVFYGLDGSGAGRMARSCRAIGYDHPVAAAALAVSGPASEDTNLRAQGVYLGTAVAPFAATDTPGAREFRAAYNSYAGGSSVDQNSMSAWASGKLLEAALGNVAQQARSGPITTQLILAGLWKIKNSSLNGLAPGITFNQNGPPGRQDCYYTLTIDNQGYAAPKGSAKTCFTALPPGF